MIRIPGIKIFFLCLFLLPSTMGFSEEIRNPELNSLLNSLTNRARALSLRTQSLEELVKKYPDQTFPLLVNILKDPIEVTSFRYLAGQKLVEINQMRAVQTLREILNDAAENPFARRTAIALLIAAKDESMTERIRQIVSNPREDPAVRQYALGLFAESDQSGKIERLRTLATSKNEALNIRTNALFLLESLQDLDFVKSSVHRFLNDENEPKELRKNILVIVERLEDQECLPILIGIAKDGRESPKFRQWVLLTLGRMGDENTLGELKRLLLSERNDVLRQAIQAAIDSIRLKLGPGQHISRHG